MLYLFCHASSNHTLAWASTPEAPGLPDRANWEFQYEQPLYGDPRAYGPDVRRILDEMIAHDGCYVFGRPLERT